MVYWLKPPHPVTATRLGAGAFLIQSSRLHLGNSRRWVRVGKTTARDKNIQVHVLTTSLRITSLPCVCRNPCKITSIAHGGDPLGIPVSAFVMSQFVGGGGGGSVFAYCSYLGNDIHLSPCLSVIMTFKSTNKSSEVDLSCDFASLLSSIPLSF